MQAAYADMPQSAVKIGVQTSLALDESFLRSWCYTTAEEDVAYRSLAIREPTLIETIVVSNSDVGYLSQSDVSCETVYLPPLSLPPETCLGLFLLFIPFRVFVNSFSLFSLIKNVHKMGLTNNPNECIEEVDVIIAGGTSHLLCST